MKIAFLTLGNHKSALYGSLIHELVNKGHEVCVINPTYDGKSELVKIEKGLRVLYFKSLPMLSIGIIRKGIANLIFPYLCLKSMKKELKDEHFDLILMTTPPLGFCKPVRYLKNKNKGSIFYLILRDIYPEGAKFIGLDKYKLIYGYFRAIEKKLYKTADFIGCMSPKNISFIKERNSYLTDSKLRLLPNWAYLDKYTNPDENIKKKYDLENRFIVIYGGNMGIPQNLNILLQLAGQKRTLKDALFLFVGNGTEKNTLKRTAGEMQLSNVRFMEGLPQEDFDDLLKVCDIGFISLHPKVPTPNIPSKTLAYFNAKLPVLAAIDPITDYGEYLLDKGQCGLWSLSIDIEGLSLNFDKLYYNTTLRKQMGENGYNYLSQCFIVDKAYDEIIVAYNRHEN
ncbi:hypothetical protein EZS27_005404 [termite gut metagenome]|uniref:Glycosyl transferase family 1 domain-containing protein n=1 Tax=termite gut metagenome TaxID=433724 RepID=A0A5J4SNT3_9ZZZZ